MNRSSAAAPSPLSGRAVTKGVDEELALFLEMRKLDKERNNLLLHNADELDSPLGSKPGTAPIFKIASSPPIRKPGIDDFLNSDGEKNDYDWLLTPPDTPLFPSLDTESKRSPIGSIDTPKDRPKMLKSRLSNAPDPPKSTLLRQPTSSSGTNSSTLGTRRPSSAGGPSYRASSSVTPDGRPVYSKPTRSSTPTSRATLPSKPLAPLRSSTPVRSSTPTSRPSVPAASKPASRSATPARGSSSSSNVPATSIPTRQPSFVTRSSPTLSKSSVPTISKTSPTISKSPAPSRGTTHTLKPKPLKPSDIPGFSHDAPANLKTSLPGRPSSVSRGRPGAPSNRSSSVEPAPTARPRRQSCSPLRGRAANGTVTKGSSVPPPSRQQAGCTDNVNPVMMGNKMVERIVNMRRLAPPKKDDQGSTQNNLSIKSSLTPDSAAGFGRTLSKKSLDMALRHMDIRRSVPNNLRPLKANIPASSVYSVRSGSSRSRGISISNSPVATGSPVSSEQSVSNNAIRFDVSEQDD
ncbi:endochitinase A-like [Zingiber officinale]|uniref:Uncharacterized protein n=1 Tax=Zingiber officinale TaxID=94328 RepID=A0A8J5G0R1_ZINOF|nr:endochitinase A-like [Zingiber officinale]XP_042413649.1 endochitinase A-like [Zingiber officinale]KAG6493947.1 hypothetical protein ZIOFF_048953 [Zingiber officinale]